MHARKQVLSALWGSKSVCNFSRVINHLRGGIESFDLVEGIPTEEFAKREKRKRVRYIVRNGRH